MRRNKYTVAAQQLAARADAGAGPLLCDFCPKRYKTEKGLEDHIENKHQSD